MPQTKLSIDEFTEWYPEASEHRYELRRGVIVEMPKLKGKHSRIAGDLAYELGATIQQNQHNYFVPKECLIKISNDTGYEPDVVALGKGKIIQEPRWERESIITFGETIKLAVEVVSTNWRDDYLIKMADYESLGIQEYWIVDYLGIGGRRYIGSPKQPTITICNLVDGEYELQQFRGNECIQSPTFPDLQLTAIQIFRAGN
jgi:Uma2 family endonuclease